MEDPITIRTARPEDAKFLSTLSAQLGYPCEEGDVRSRIERGGYQDDDVVLVADREGRVIAWTSVQIVRHFYLDPFAQVSGFVVDERYRSRGVGRRLMEAAAAWVKNKGFDTLRLNANVKRVSAHRFYENNGFARIKEQYVFVRRME